MKHREKKTETTLNSHTYAFRWLSREKEKKNTVSLKKCIHMSDFGIPFVYALSSALFFSPSGFKSIVYILLLSSTTLWFTAQSKFSCKYRLISLSCLFCVLKISFRLLKKRLQLLYSIWITLAPTLIKSLIAP